MKTFLERITEALRLVAEGNLEDAQRILEALAAEAAQPPPAEEAALAADPGYPPPKADVVSSLKKAIALLNEGKTEDAKTLLLSLLGKDYGYPSKAADTSPTVTPTHDRVDVQLGQPQKEGRSWDVTLIKAGRTKNDYLYPADLLKSSLHLFEGLRCYDSHLTDEEMEKNPVRKVGDLLGWFDNISWDDASSSVRALFHCASQWLRDMLMNLHKEGKDNLVGFSIDSFIAPPEQRQIEGHTIKVVHNLLQINSVDLVTAPAAGGSVDRLVASLSPTPLIQPTPANDAAPLANLAHRLYQVELRETLADSQLPKPARDFLYRQLSGTILPTQRITTAIADQRQVLSDLSPGAHVTSQGIIRDVHPVMEINDFARDLEALCGWADPTYKPRFRRLSEWYMALTGDDKFFGSVAPTRVTEANVTVATLANICASVLNKRLAAEWAPMERWWEPLVTEHTEPLYQDVKIDHTYGFSALSTVTEGDPYVEKTWDDIVETATFSKKGNYVGITLEAIMADNVGGIRRIPGALARAWFYTLSDLVSGVFTENSGIGPQMTDATYIFQVATHANLLTAALDFDNFDTAQTAMMNQTEPGSTRKLAIPAKYLLVPVDLRTTGIILRNTLTRTATADNDTNPWYQQFEVVVVPPWTDTNNWALVADPKRLPCISLHYLQGLKTPELFTADSPIAGAMFTNDELRIKIRGIVARGVSDFRGLHKSNVA